MRAGLYVSKAFWAILQGYAYKVRNAVTPKLYAKAVNPKPQTLNPKGSRAGGVSIGLQRRDPV